MPESNVPITAGAGTPVATYTDPAGNQRQVVVIGDAATGVAAVPGGELTVASIYLELILTELRRVSAYLSLLTGETIADDDLPELN